MPLSAAPPHDVRAGARCLLAAAASLAGPALAHEGHGLPGHAHWHATDVLGFVALAVGAGALIWWRGRK